MLGDAHGGGWRAYGMDLPSVLDTETPVEADVHVLQVHGSCCPPHGAYSPHVCGWSELGTSL